MYSLVEISISIFPTQVHYSRYVVALSIEADAGRGNGIPTKQPCLDCAMRSVAATSFLLQAKVRVLFEMRSCLVAMLIANSKKEFVAFFGAMREKSFGGAGLALALPSSAWLTLLWTQGSLVGHKTLRHRPSP
jgi:hypothetical protein